MYAYLMSGYAANVTVPWTVSCLMYFQIAILMTLGIRVVPQFHVEIASKEYSSQRMLLKIVHGYLIVVFCATGGA